VLSLWRQRCSYLDVDYKVASELPSVCNKKRMWRVWSMDAWVMV